MKTITVGLIGASGNRGIVFQRLISKHPELNARITATADIEEEVQPLLNSAVDAVIVSSPDWLHEDHACRALKVGKAVYLEKPMAITPEGCSKVILAANQSKSLLYIGHNLRHFSVLSRMNDFVCDGLVGRIRAVLCKHSVNYGYEAYFAPGRWHMHRKNIGSLLVHKGVHDLDVIQWFTGDQVSQVVALGGLKVFRNIDGNPDVEDISSVIMKTRHHDVHVQYTQCHFAHRACREYTIIGEKGTLENIGDRPRDNVIRHSVNEMIGMRAKSKEQYFSLPAEKGFHGDADVRVLTEFFGVMRGTAKPTTTPQDAMHAVRVACAATESLRNGSQPIYI